MKQYSVRDGVRTLRFEGVLLAESSSQRPGNPRWVEFQLYRTKSGQYVVSRIGASLFFHDSDCKTTSRNRLSAVDGMELHPAYVPCQKCSPSRIDEAGVFPETPRYWAQVSETGVGVVASVMQKDDNNVEYLTNVARRLLMKASAIDDVIYDAFHNDFIE